MGFVIQALLVFGLSEQLFCLRPPTNFKPFIYGASLNKYFGPKKISLPERGIKDFVIKPPKDDGDGEARASKDETGSVATKSPVFSVSSTKTTERPTKASNSLTSKESTREDLDSESSLAPVTESSDTSTQPDVTTATTTTKTTTNEPRVKRMLDMLLHLAKTRLRRVEEKLEAAGVVTRTAATKTDRNSIPGLTERIEQIEKLFLIPTGPDLTFTDKKYTSTLNDSRATSPIGMGFSRYNHNILYVINDAELSANDNHLHIFNAISGQKVLELDIPNVTNTAWSDLSVGPCSGRISKSCIYILNTVKSVEGKSPALIIYMFEEPKLVGSTVTAMEQYPKKLVLSGYDHTVKAMAVSAEGVIYLFPQANKMHGHRIQKIEKGRFIEVCPIKLKFHWRGPVGAAMSEDGRMVLIKMADFIYMYNVPSKNYDNVLCDERQQIQLNYTTDHESEAISFSPDGWSYYTCSRTLYSPLWRYDRVLIGSSGP